MSSLAIDFSRALDPVNLMADAGMQPDPWQAKLLRSNHDRHLLLCSRQSGKSTTCAALALHQAFYDPGLVLMVAPAQRQSAELFRKVLDIYNRLDDTPRTVNESALRLELANGSRVIALPGTESTIRGYSAAKTIIIDEASRVDDGLFAAVRPILATTQGRLIALTTPYGRRGWFFEAWDHGKGWQRTKITASECPRITPEWLKGERELIGPWQYQQEYECAFVDTDEAFFSSALIEAALSDGVRPLWKL